MTVVVGCGCSSRRRSEDIFYEEQGVHGRIATCPEMRTVRCRLSLFEISAAWPLIGRFGMMSCGLSKCGDALG